MTLGSSMVQAFLATTDAAAAKRFYGEVLELRLVSDESFALVYEVKDAQLRIQKAREFTPYPFTAFGWIVPDIAAEVRRLVARGVRFERWDHVPSDELGIWTTPGAKVAWFKDPDGNLLSLAQLG